MALKTNIMILGFMGTGKSTVGRRVAALLGKRFVDMDQVIEERQGKSITRIFAEDGEPRFRELERELILELAREQDLVVAAGGGVVLNPQNITDFERTGVTVCLTASPETILRRVEAESHRPLLEDGDKARKILGLLETRKPLYEAVRHKVDTTLLAPPDVARRVVDFFMADNNGAAHRNGG